ncbi:MAG: hypothetical protein OXH10_06420 [bacterium]|nr:hypothetical protein [bacterium]
MQEIILGALSAVVVSLLGILIQGIRADMRALRTEMAEGFRRLEERIAANGERIATLEGIISVTHPRLENPPQPPQAIEDDSSS